MTIHQRTRVYGHRSFTIRRQFLPYTCGSVSTVMILEHFGYVLHPAAAACSLFTNPITGTSLSRIAELLRGVGLAARYTVSAGITDFRDVLARGGLVLAHVDNNHVGVLYALAGTEAWFADPSLQKGPRPRVPLMRFLRRFDGEALLVTPGRHTCECSPSSLRRQTAPHGALRTRGFRTRVS